MPSPLLASSLILPSLLLLGAFLCGAVPYGWLIARAHGVDLRQVGSGNIGATNAGRALGRKWGVLVVLLDALKGAVPVLGARWLGASELVPLLAGALAVLGHSYTPFLGWRGGKGVATAAGAFLAMHPAAVGLALVSWLLALALSRQVALASLVSAWVLPGLVWWMPRSDSVVETRGILVLSVAMTVLITLRHRANISRILRGEEPRIGRLLGRRSPPLGRES